MTVEERVEQLVTHGKDGIRIGNYLLKTPQAPGGPAPTEKAIGIMAGAIRRTIVGVIKEFQGAGAGTQAAAKDGAGPAEEPEQASPTVIVNEQLIQLIIDKIAEQMAGLFGSSDPTVEINVGSARQAAVERAKLVTPAEILAALPPELLAQPEAPAAEAAAEAAPEDKAA